MLGRFLMAIEYISANDLRDFEQELEDDNALKTHINNMDNNDYGK